MTVRVRLEDLVDKIKSDSSVAVVRGLRSAAYRMLTIVPEEIHNTDPYPAIDTGELMRSIDKIDTDTGALIEANAPHAAFIEYGTRPHYPPIQPLAEWAKRKGLASTDAESESVARAIALKIARRGTEPRHFMKKSVETMKRRNIIKEEIVAELKDMT